MGIAGNYGIDSADIRWAADHGANYWVWGRSFSKVTHGIKEVIRSDRENHVVAIVIFQNVLNQIPPYFSH